MTDYAIYGPFLPLSPFSNFTDEKAFLMKNQYFGLKTKYFSFWQYSKSNETQVNFVDKVGE